MGTQKEFLEREVAKRAQLRAAEIRASLVWHDTGHDTWWANTELGKAVVWKESGKWRCGWSGTRWWYVENPTAGKEKVAQWLEQHHAPPK